VAYRPGRGVLALQTTERVGGKNRPDRPEASQMRTIPANLCLFLRWVEFSGVGEDFDEAAGKASELAA
jgi:hypothetical protein